MKGTVFTIDLNDVSASNWVVYSLYDTAGALQYIGHTHFKNLLSIPDARTHSMFSKIFLKDVPVTVRINEIYKTKGECILYVNRYLSKNPRPFMMKYIAAYRNKVKVKCIETGEEFESITECSAKQGVSASALSNHLIGNPSYLTVKGLTYEYLT